MKKFRVFYDKDLGSFTSFKADLSDLGGPYLEAALANIAAKAAPVNSRSRDGCAQNNAQKLYVSNGLQERNR